MRSRRCRMPETAGLGQLREKKRRREFTIRYTQPCNWLPPVFRANGLIELYGTYCYVARSFVRYLAHRNYDNRVYEFKHSRFVDAVKHLQ